MGYSKNRPIIQIDNKELSSQLAENKTLFSQENLISKNNIVPSDHVRGSDSLSRFEVVIDSEGTNALIRTIPLVLEVGKTYKFKTKIIASGELLRFHSYPADIFPTHDFYAENGQMEKTYEFTPTQNDVQFKIVAPTGLIGTEIIFTDLILREKETGFYINNIYDETIRHMNETSLPTTNKVFNGNGGDYHAFTGGTVHGGVEYYAFRVSPNGHMTSNDPTKWGYVRIVRRKKGTLEFETFEEISESDGEPRDINLSISSSGQRMFLSYAITDSDGSVSSDYKNVYYVYEWNLVRSPRILMTDETENTFGWGNLLQTPQGRLIKCAYTTELTPNPEGKPTFRTVIYRSANTDPVNPGIFTKVEVASIVGNQCTEATIGYYRNKLVCMIRNLTGFSIAITGDLEGTSGWGLQTDTGLTLHAPCLNPYNEPNEDLYFTASRQTQDSNGNDVRKPYFGVIKKPNAKNNSIKIGEKRLYVLDDEMRMGGYTTLVRVSKDTFGIMYYVDEAFGGASQYFIEVSKSSINLTEYDTEDTNISNVRNYVREINSDSIKYEFATVDVSNVPVGVTTYDFDYIYKEVATYDIVYAEGFVDNQRPQYHLHPKTMGKDNCVFEIKASDGSNLPSAMALRIKITKLMTN